VTTLEAKGWPVDRAALAVRFNIPLIEGAALDVKPEEKPETNRPAEKTSQESSDESENGESSRMAAE
jgi:hypothetical protein